MAYPKLWTVCLCPKDRSENEWQVATDFVDPRTVFLEHQSKTVTISCLYVREPLKASV